MLAVVARDRAVSCLGLHDGAVRGDEDGRHHAERAVALRDDVGLHVTVVVLAGPHEPAAPLQRGGDHVVDEPVLVSEPLGVHLRLELLEVHLLEDVLEAAVVDLQDRVLRGHVQRVVALDRVVEARAGEAEDRIVRVVHTHRDARGLELHDLPGLRLAAAVRGEGHRERALAGDDHVRRAVLVAVSVAPDDDRLGPAGNQMRDVVTDDRLTEDRTADDVADRAVR